MEKTLVARLRLEIGDYLAGLAKAGVATGQFVRNVSGAGAATDKQIRDVSRGALVMAAGVTVALGAAVKAAMDWETAWAGVTKTVDGSHDEMAALEGDLRQLATTLPASHDQIAAVAEAAGQLGIERESVASFTRTMIDLGETTNLTADEAATSIAQLINIMGDAPSEVDNLGAALVDLGNHGASTEADILSMALRVAGAGKLVGATTDEVLALSSSMASLGIQSELGGGAMSRTLNKIYVAAKDSGEALDGFAEIANMSADEFAAKWEDDPIRALDAFIVGLDQVGTSGGNVVAALREVGIKGTQDLQVLLRMRGAAGLLTKDLDLSSKAWLENTALQQEAAKRYDTTASQLRVLRNQIVDVGIDMGGVLLPAVKSVTSGLGTMVTGFGEIDGAGRTLIVTLASIAGSATGFIGLLGVVGPKVNDFRAGLQGMGAAGQFVNRNFGAIVGTLTAVGGALAIYTYALGENAQKQREERLAAKGFADAITEAGDAAAGTANHVRDLVESSPELTRMLSETDSTLDDMTSALLDGGAEWTAFKDKILDAASGSGISLQLLEGALDGVAEASRTGAADSAHLADVETQSLTPVEKLAAARKNLAEETKKTADAVKELIDAELAQVDPLFGMWAALNDNYEANRDLQEVIADSESTLREWEEAHTDAAKSALAVNAAAIELAGGIAAGTVQVELAEAMLADWVAQGLITIETAGQVTAQFRAAARHANELAGEKVMHLRADDGVTPVLDDIERRLSVFGTIKAKLAVAGSVNDITSPSRWGNVYAYAGGGITPAHIARGTRLKYAEPATGGEAFIPRHGDPMRSLGIISEAAGWYGHTISPASRFAGSGSAPTMVVGGGGGGAPVIHVTLNVEGSVHSKESLMREMVTGLRKATRTMAGGDAQKMFGR